MIERIIREITGLLRRVEQLESQETYGPLVAWTPAVTQLGAVAATVTRARYRKIGQTITAWCNLAVTGAGTIGNIITVSVPVNMVAPSNWQPVGTWVIYRGGTVYSGVVAGASASTVGFWTYNVAAFEGGGYALANGDQVGIIIEYEVA